MQRTTKAASVEVYENKAPKRKRNKTTKAHK
jgi:hypothetical protein